MKFKAFEEANKEINKQFEATKPAWNAFAKTFKPDVWMPIPIEAATEEPARIGDWEE